MVLNATFNNISVISWWSVLLVGETGGVGENHRPVVSHWQTLSHIMLYTSPWSRSELTASVVIDTDCIGSCKSNYHTITATTAPALQRTKPQTTTPDKLLLNSCYLKLSRVSIVTVFIHKTLIYIPSYRWYVYTIRLAQLENANFDRGCTLAAAKIGHLSISSGLNGHIKNHTSWWAHACCILFFL